MKLSETFGSTLGQYRKKDKDDKLSTNLYLVKEEDYHLVSDYYQSKHREIVEHYSN